MSLEGDLKKIEKYLKQTSSKSCDTSDKGKGFFGKLFGKRKNKTWGET